MSEPNQPGWYQDPAGRQGDARWWDGVGWTDQTMPYETTTDSAEFAHLPTLQSGSATGAHTVYSPGAMGEYEVFTPSVASTSTAQHPQWYHAAQAPPPAPEPDRPGRRFDLGLRDAPPQTKRNVWYALGALGIIALVVVLLLVTGVFTAKTPDDNAGSPQSVNVAPPSSQSDQHALRIVDKDSGISYDYLGEGWKDFQLGAVLENQTTVGEYIITQKKVPTGGEFIAQVTSGLLAQNFGSPTPDGYASTLEAVEQSVRGHYYPEPNQPTNLKEEAVKIDGHAAYKRSFDLKWDVKGYDSTGERVVLVLIDSGKSSPVFFYCSFPNTHAELYPLIDKVIASIKVDS